MKEAIESTLWCDRIFVVDGAFPGFPTNSPQSNDGTIEIVRELQKQHPDKIRLFTFDDFVETTQKMNVYLAQMRIGDFFLRLNGDEFVESNHENPYKFLAWQIAESGELPLYQIGEYPVGDERKYYYCPKLLKKTETLNLTSRHVIYTNNFEPHYELIGQRGKVSPCEANLPMNLLRIKHMKEQRNEERQRLNIEWIKYYSSHQFKQGII